MADLGEYAAPLRILRGSLADAQMALDDAGNAVDALEEAIEKGIEAWKAQADG